MSKKNRARSKPAPRFVAPAIGDAFRDVDYSPIQPLDTPLELAGDVSTNNVPLLTLISMALKLGHDPKIVCGVDDCMDHNGWLVCTDRFSTTSTKAGQYHYGIDIVWCRQCLQWRRDPEPQNLSADYTVSE